jgi:hypothetical protein
MRERSTRLARAIGHVSAIDNAKNLRGVAPYARFDDIIGLRGCDDRARSGADANSAIRIGIRIVSKGT